ncbi:RNA-binding protein [Achlya hypogyna]|uniref:RNA-binding protein n=1 Tax=Achlya hypogyna TaxID=1202772 RepID=A0A1V9YAQ1_ACHHY|nr:RNA-binding protein [Achlya hypogyna]
MSSLDDELALFQEEIASIEKETKKRAIDDADEVARKRQKAMEVAKAIMAKAAANPVPTSAPQVIVRAPTASVPKPPAPVLPTALPRDTAPSNSVSIMHGQALPTGSSMHMEAIDHNTGMPLTSREQLIFSQQQSVYRYRPERNVANAAVNSDKKFLRVAAGKVWEDATLAEWPENDYRLFCGDLGNEVNDELLTQAFSTYSSFAMAKVVRDKLTHKSRGYGFVSFLDPFDAAKAMRDMNGKYIGNRPVKISKGKWADRALDVVKKKVKAGKKSKKHLFS